MILRQAVEFGSSLEQATDEQTHAVLMATFIRDSLQVMLETVERHTITNPDPEKIMEAHEITIAEFQRFTDYMRHALHMPLPLRISRFNLALMESTLNITNDLVVLLKKPTNLIIVNKHTHEPGTKR